MRAVKYTGRFKRDYRREKSGQHGKKLDKLLMDVLDMLAADTALPRRNFDHPLTGDWSDHRDCHVPMARAASEGGKLTLAFPGGEAAPLIVPLEGAALRALHWLADCAVVAR